MDSGGNSGSMQSSSTGGGGDEAEYDSSSHPFFHVGGGGGVSGGGGSSIQAPSLQQQSSLFDSLSNFLITDHNNSLFSPPLSLSSSSSRPNQNPSSSLNLDILLQNPSTTIPRSQLNSFNSLMTSSTSSPSHQQQSVLPHSGRVASQNPLSFPTNNNSTDHQHQANINNQQPNRITKKRSRASRRAPTTVLTTDTSNFRSMVQEFTGMPTQPFASSSSLLFPRNTRLDLFSNSSTTSTVRSGGGGCDSPYLLRPFAQKPHQIPPFLSSSTSSMILNSNATASTSTTNTNPSMSSSNASNFQLLSDQLGFPSNKNNQSLLNMQTNPSLIPYQSLLLQSNPINQSNDVHRANLSSSGGGGGSRGLPNLVTSDGLTMPMRNNSSSWENQDHILNGNYNNSHRHQQQQQMVTGNAEKGSAGSQNVSTRGEGMVNSWICSSE